MIAVLPEFRRQGLATLLVEKSKELAHDQNYNIVRMDCINPHELVPTSSSSTAFNSPLLPLDFSLESRLYKYMTAPSIEETSNYGVT